MANSDLFTLQAGSPTLSKVVSFGRANGVAIDNATVQYVYMPQIGLFIRPNAFATFPLNGAASIQAEFAAPPNVTQPAAIAGQQAFIYLTEDTLPFYNGPTTGGQVLSAADVVLIGTLATRPAFGTAGRLYYASDTGQFFRDSGAAWTELAIGTNNSGTVWAAGAQGYIQNKNNQNVIAALDRSGVIQNMAIIDTNDIVVLGPQSPSLARFAFPSPLRVARVVDEYEFEGAGGPLAAGANLWPPLFVTRVGTGTDAFDPAIGANSNLMISTSAGGVGDGEQVSILGTHDQVGSSLGFWVLQFAEILNVICTFGYFSEAAAGTDFVRFRFTNAGAATNWQCETSLAGVVTTVDSGVLSDAVNRFTYAIDIRTAGHARFAINNVAGNMGQVADITTNLPVATDLMRRVTWFNNANAVNKRLLLDYMGFVRNR